MNIIKDEKKIKRNGKFGQWVSLGALVVLGGGMYISFSRPEWFAYSLMALVLGFMLSQIGMYMGNRWGRSPRPDEQLDASLKGLPGEYTIYHYTAPVSHLLVGPAGVWILLPYRQNGHVVYEKKRWKVKNGGFIQGYLSVFGQEGLGRPDLESDAEIASLEKFFSKKLERALPPSIDSALIFTNTKVEIQNNDAPIPAMQIDKLKGFIRQKAKEKPLSSSTIKAINEALQ